MKLLSNIGQWFGNIRTRIRVSNEKHRISKLNNLSCELVNVMEFDGRLYIAFGGAPVVRVDDLKVKATDLLAQSRADYLAWKEKFEK